VVDAKATSWSDVQPDTDEGLLDALLIPRVTLWRDGDAVWLSVEIRGRRGRYKGRLFRKGYNVSAKIRKIGLLLLFEILMW